MSENSSPGSNEDLKAKMREALDRKKANDHGVDHADHDKGHAEAHGPGGKRVHRRKSG